MALYLASLAEVGQGRTLTRVEITAIAWGVNILSGIINTIGTKAIGHMSAFNLWWTLGGTFVLVITLLVKAPVKVCNLCSPSSWTLYLTVLAEQRCVCVHRLREVRTWPHETRPCTDPDPRAASRDGGTGPNRFRAREPSVARNPTGTWPARGSEHGTRPNCSKNG